jgi:hypothetical protein
VTTTTAYSVLCVAAREIPTPSMKSQVRRVPTVPPDPSRALMQSDSRDSAASCSRTRAKDDPRRTTSDDRRLANPRALFPIALSCNRCFGHEYVGDSNG